MEQDEPLHVDEADGAFVLDARAKRDAELVALGDVNVRAEKTDTRASVVELTRRTRDA